MNEVYSMLLPSADTGQTGGNRPALSMSNRAAGTLLVAKERGSQQHHQDGYEQDRGEHVPYGAHDGNGQQASKQASRH